jgi:gamma-D-glutamyl-L-lysine dipeptidyl-peptidase
MFYSIKAGFFLFLNTMKYAIVTVPAAPVRNKPNHRSEMVNQLLFGEAVKIIGQRGEKWLKVESLYDHYKGWVTNHLVTEVENEEALLPVTHITGGLLNMIVVNDSVLHAPMGSFLFGFKDKNGGFENFTYQYQGKAISFLPNNKLKNKLIVKFALQWLNAPYLWGGKTILGVDCSGFSQTIFKMAGIQLPRDAWQQAGEGKRVKKLNDAQAGDLAFFDDKDEIVHVGILLDSDKIIHAAGKVRIDPIDEKGIVNNDTGKRTHKLKIIKRVID